MPDGPQAVSHAAHLRSVPRAASDGRSISCPLNSWALDTLDLKPRLPEILSSSDAARAIVLDLAAGESLSDHVLHERAWVVVIYGEVEASTPNGERARGEAGLLVEFAPGERHELQARANARLLLLLTPWPGSGHPGAMTIREKLYARRHAAKRKQ
jgi:quercetin dioxygenase-like cupin family protein